MSSERLGLDGNDDSIKEQQLLRHLADMENEYVEKIRCLESSLQHATTENDAYDSQIAALRQHNEYLREASTEWHTKYNETKIHLLNAKDEIMRLQSELSNMRILYNEMNEKHIKNNVQTTNDAMMSKQSDTEQIKLQQYMDENKRIKAENIEYLNELKTMSQKHRESNFKHNALSNMQMSLKNDYNAAKMKISELESIINDYVLEVGYLEHENAELKQSLAQNMGFDVDMSDNGIIPVSYAPESKPKLLRVRSNSAVSVSACGSNAELIVNSPVLNHRNFSGNVYNFHLTPSPTPKPMDDRLMKEENGIEVNLYHIMNGHLFEIEECVQNLYKLKQIATKNKARASSFSLLQVPFTELSLAQDRKSVEDGEEEKEVETVSLVVGSNEEKEELYAIDDVLQKAKKCASEIHQQQLLKIEHERKQLDALHNAHNRYRKQSAVKIKRLTKDLYRTKYRKWNGCREILFEAIGNAGAYTKDAIIKRLIGKKSHSQ